MLRRRGTMYDGSFNRPLSRCQGAWLALADRTTRPGCDYTLASPQPPSTTSLQPTRHHTPPPPLGLASTLPGLSLAPWYGGCDGPILSPAPRLPGDSQIKGKWSLILSGACGRSVCLADEQSARLL
ncbi:unnamed protein product [Arctogadus glacialis]